MFYECNDRIFLYHRRSPSNLLEISMGNVFWDLSTIDQLPTHSRAWHFQEQTLHYLLLGFPWCHWVIKPSNLLSLQKSGTETALTSFLQTKIHSCVGWTNQARRGTFRRDFSGQGYNFHWDQKLPGKRACWISLETNQILQTTRLSHCFLPLIPATKKIKNQTSFEGFRKREQWLIKLL